MSNELLRPLRSHKITLPFGTGDRTEDYDMRFNRMQKLDEAWVGVKTCTGEDCYTVFSDSEMAAAAADVMGTNPLDWLGWKPFESNTPGGAEAILIVRDRDDFFGDSESKDFSVSLPLTATLFELLNAVDKSIPVTNDYHHKFFEGFDASIGYCDSVPVLVLRPSMGS